MTSPIAKLFDSYQKSLAQKRWRPDDIRFNVNVTISRLAFVYEKIRNAIDYKDEHLLRKNAIERILKRRLFTEIKKTGLAHLLISELIRARYLPNNMLPERMIGEVDAIIEKYLRLLSNLNVTRLTKRGRQIVNWTMSVLAAEIEHYLVPPFREDGVVECMYKCIKHDVDLAKEIADSSERSIQMYLAIHKVLIKSDPAILRYHLLVHLHPEWLKGGDAAIQHLVQHFDAFQKYIEYQLNHPLADKLFRFMKRFSTVFIILKDIADQDPSGFPYLMQDREAFEQRIRQACAVRYAKANAKLRRSYIRTIIYVFFTKMLLALLFELPYDLYFLKTTNYTPLMINVIFHPILMFIIAASIRMPSQKNTDKIVEILMRIAHEEPQPGFLYRKRMTFGRSALVQNVFRLLNGLTYLVSFGLLVWALHLLHFNIVSGILFVFFLSIISFFGLKLRREVKDLIIVDKRNSLFSALIDFFSVPILSVGQWISAKTPKINLFLFVMDFVIEAPFKIFMDVIEDWINFQKEKREEIM